MRSAILFGAILFAVAAIGLAGSPSARADDRVVQVAIDMDVAGNTFNSLGPSEDCNTTALSVGDTIDVDVVVRGVPEHEPADALGYDPKGGIAGVEFQLFFDPEIVWVKEVQKAAPTLWGGGSPSYGFWHVDYYSDSGDPPGKTGVVYAAGADVSSNYESGDGILVRLTLQAVGDGTSPLVAEDDLEGNDYPSVYASDTFPYAVSMSQSYVVVGGGDCVPPPTPTLPVHETPTGFPSSATPSPTPLVTAGTLPHTGGTASSSASLVVVGTIALGMSVLVAGLWIARKGLV